MSTYPPNQTTPKKGSDGYLWNWLGSSLKKFGAAISPYITGGGGESYKKYVALLTQSGTDAPVATVLENTLGSDITWNRQSDGIYYGENINFVDGNKVWMTFQSNNSDYGNGSIQIISSEIYNDNKLWFSTMGGLIYAGAPYFKDNWGTYISVEIRVYP